MRAESDITPKRATTGTAITGFLRGVLTRQETAIILPFVAISLFFYLRNHAMLSPLFISSLLRTMAYPGLIAMGMVMLMISGEIDLSTERVMSFSAVAAAWLMKMAGWPIWLSVVAALVGALLIGAINAWLTIKMGVNSIISTIAVGFAVHGLSYLPTNGLPIYPLPAGVAYLGNLRPLGVSFAFWLMIGLMVVIQFILNGTRWGNMVFATGGNRQAAEICGINTARVKTVCFMLTSLLAGVSGLLVMSGLPLTPGDPVIGKDLSLNIIAGVILGGVSFYGGRGTAIGTLFGVVMMQVIRSGLVVAHFDMYYQFPVLGAFMVLAASVDIIRHRRREG
jgi:ribose transport system permease protein